MDNILQSISDASLNTSKIVECLLNNPNLSTLSDYQATVETLNINSTTNISQNAPSNTTPTNNLLLPLNEIKQP